MPIDLKDKLTYSTFSCLDFIRGLPDTAVVVLHQQDFENFIKHPSFIGEYRKYMNREPNCIHYIFPNQMLLFKTGQKIVTGEVWQ